MDPLHDLGLADLLREHARSRPQGLAAVDGDRRLTWPELDARCARLAAALRADGFRAGDRVLWLGQNSHRLLEAFLAAARLGGVFCPANWRQSPEELAWTVADCAPRLVLWQERELGEGARQARKAAPAGPRWLQHDDEGPEGYEAWLAAASDEDPGEPVDPRLPVLQMYTAAFGGRPKGALLSHHAVLIQALVMARVQDVGPDTVFLNSGPLFHVATFMTTAATFVWGGTNVFTARAEPEEIARLVDRERCTNAFLMGPTVDRIVELNRDGRYDLSSLRALGGSSAWRAMTTPDPSPWGGRPGGYGQTEVMGLLTLAALGPDAEGPAGRPIPGVRVRIADPEGRELPPGETGEIQARGPTVLCAYHGQPEATAARRDGIWHRTGDLGRREPDGSLRFVGPKTRLIKTGAENVYPAEVEGCLRQHPAVADCAVIGVPDPGFGQSVKAIVALREGERATADDLIAHCRARIASYKKPRHVAFVDALPRRGLAVDYAALDAAHGGGNYPGTP